MIYILMFLMGMIAGTVITYDYEERKIRDIKKIVCFFQRLSKVENTTEYKHTENVKKYSCIYSLISYIKNKIKTK